MGAEPESTYITGYRPRTKMGPQRNSDNSVYMHGLILAPIFFTNLRPGRTCSAHFVAHDRALDNLNDLVNSIHSWGFSTKKKQWLSN